MVSLSDRGEPTTPTTTKIAQSSLHSASAVRRWIPSIKAEISFCVDQLSGIRPYPQYKIDEFEERLAHLEGEYKRFAGALDPTAPYLPGAPHAYVRKRTLNKENPSGTVECSAPIDSDLHQQAAVPMYSSSFNNLATSPQPPEILTHQDPLPNVHDNPNPNTITISTTTESSGTTPSPSVTLDTSPTTTTHIASQCLSSLSGYTSD
ncbi:hypothetical protein Pelo_1903 [Pelomyxa schiedti]|nr:hypothetical protein Pelo_1903 [Pelomyxa schiedti]